MNVTTVGTPPAPLPALLPIQRAAATEQSPDAGAQETPQRKAASQRAEQQRAERKAEQQAATEAPKPPPLKPVTTKEFQVFVGALPVTVLHDRKTRDRGYLDVYV